jgi:WD40 repeat protein
MRRASLPPRPSLLPSRDEVPFRFGSARGRLPSPRALQLAPDGSLAWGLCARDATRAVLVAWRPRDAALAWRFELPGDARFGVSSDGALLVLCDPVGWRALLDARTGALLSESNGHGALPDAVLVARAATRRALLVTGATASLVDLDTARPLATFTGAAPAALSPDASHVALTTRGAVTVHRVADGSSRAYATPRGARVSALDLDNTGSLALGFDNGTAARHHPHTRTRRTHPSPTAHAVTALRAAADGALAIGHADGLVRLLSPHAPPREVVGDGAVEAIAATLDGALFREPRAAPWIDLASGTRHDVRAGHLDAVTALALGPDGRTVVTASRDRTLRVWDVTTGDTRLSLEGHTSPIASLALSRDGRSAFSCGERDGLRAWNLTTGDERPLDAAIASRVRATRLALSPCGERILCLHAHTEALVLDARTGALLARAPLHAGSDAVAFDARGEVLHVHRGSSREGLRFERLHLATGTSLGDVILPHTPRIARRATPCALVRSIGDALVTAETDRAAIARWTLDGAPSALRHAAGGDLLRAPVVALGERHLVAASGARLDVADVTTGARATLRLPERHDAVTCLAVDASGEWFLAGTAQGLVQRFAL